MATRAQILTSRNPAEAVRLLARETEAALIRDGDVGGLGLAKARIWAVVRLVDAGDAGDEWRRFLRLWAAEIGGDLGDKAGIVLERWPAAE